MSEDDIKRLLQKNLEVSQESLDILKKINRARIISNIFTFLKWVIIIGLALGAFYYLEPYVDQIKNTYKEIQNLQQNISSTKLPR